MALLVVGTEKNFAGLRSRLFEGRVSPKVAARVAAAVQAANPHADLDRLTPGTVLTIPDEPKVRIRGELSWGETAKVAIGEIAQGAQLMLEEVVTIAKVREREDAAERKAILTALGSRELRAAMREDPEFGSDVDVAFAALEKEGSSATERAAALKGAQADWSSEIDLLSEQLERRL
jgi:hypothetical protein